jgi:hypothetical protein
MHKWYSTHFRDTDFLKQEKNSVKTIAPNLNGEDLGKELHIKSLKQNEKKVMWFSLKKVLQ